MFNDNFLVVLCVPEGRDAWIECRRIPAPFMQTAGDEVRGGVVSEKVH